MVGAKHGAKWSNVAETEGPEGPIVLLKLRAPTVVSNDSEKGGFRAVHGPGPAAVLRGNEPHRATRYGGLRGVPEPVTARNEMGVLITASEVAPVTVTAGDVATVPVTAGGGGVRAGHGRGRGVTCAG